MCGEIEREGGGGERGKREEERKRGRERVCGARASQRISISVLPGNGVQLYSVHNKKMR